MNMAPLITQFRARHRWIVKPSSSVQLLSNTLHDPWLTIPKSLIEFYTSCGGIENSIYQDEDLPLSIVTPEKFKWVPEEILGNVLEKVQTNIEEEIFWNWYIIGRGDTNEYVAIDLAPERLEKCYFFNFYLLGQKNTMPLVANSLEELLQVFLEAVEIGEAWDWHKLGLGYAC